jgi:hypothetical protein
MLSPNFQVANYTLEEFNQKPVSITYRFKDAEKIVTKELFKVGSNFPSTKSVTFENKVGNCDLLIQYSEEAEIPEGIPKQIAQYDISEAKKEDKTEKCSFTMRISNNIHNVPQLDEVEFVQEWTEEEKIPVKVQGTSAAKTEEKKQEQSGEDKPMGEGAESEKSRTDEGKKEEEKKEPEIQYEIKQRAKKSFSKIKFATSNFALAPSVKGEYKGFEDKLMDRDNNILEMKRLRNSLEAYSYEMRNNLESYGSWEKYLDEQTRTSFIAEINQVVEWIYGEGEQAAKEEYRKRLDKFKLIGEPVKQRHFYYSELSIYFSQFETLTNIIKDKLASIAHLSQEQKDLVLKKQEEGEKFMAGVKADQESKQLYQDPSFSLDQIINTLNLLRKETEAIFNAPAPKADEQMKDESKSEKKEEEDKKDDVEMNGEEKKSDE